MPLLNLFEFTSVTFLSAPNTADVCRAQLEKLLVQHKTVEVDCTNVYLTPGFVHHLLKPLIDRRGIALLKRIYFANHTESTLYNIAEAVENFKETTANPYNQSGVELKPGHPLFK